MEILEKKIKEFLKIETVNGDGSGSGSGSGDGYGYGSGFGFGNGSGSGYDSGSGSGSGSGDGSGSGSGSGDGYGDGSGSGDGYGSGSGSGSGDDFGYGFGFDQSNDLKSINNKTIYRIDGVNTIILHINKNVAKGKIVNKNLTMDNCYIVKGSNQFAHGETIKKAMESLQEKIYENLDVEEAIAKFKEQFNDLTKKYNAKDFYLWHHILTGSCEMGRKNFAKNHDIDLEKDKFTIKEFIELTENDYGGHIIKQLKESYNID